MNPFIERDEPLRQHMEAKEKKQNKRELSPGSQPLYTIHDCMEDAEMLAGYS
jgi:hypothetical protein